MALLSPQYFPRSMFDMNEWFRNPMSPVNSLFSSFPSLSTLDLFDPFDELDSMLSRNLYWLSRPDFLRDIPLMPRVPQKYRISVDCAGFAPQSIKTELKDNNKLVVSAHEEDKAQAETGDYSKKEFRKTYDLPAEVEKDKMVSFMAGDRLIVELPLKETKQTPNASLFPRTVDNKDGTKSIEIQFNIPQNVDPAKINVSVKDRDLIVRVEDRVRKADGLSRFHYYQRTTLPENTKLDELKCAQENNVVTCTAPLDLDYKKSFRSIPVEHKQPQQEVIKPPAPQQSSQAQQAQQSQQPQQQQEQKMEEMVKGAEQANK